MQYPAGIDWLVRYKSAIDLDLFDDLELVEVLKDIFYKGTLLANKRKCTLYIVVELIN